MKKIFLVLLLSFVCFSGFGQSYADKFTASLPNFAIGLGYGTLKSNKTHSALSLYANFVGFTITGDMITDGEDDEPDFYEVLFGYQVPVLTNYDKKDSGYALYVTPLIGASISDVSYKTFGGGEYVESREKELSYGGVISLRFGGSMGGQINVKISNNGVSGGIAFVLGK